jgi:predicted GNAT family acetyltransferase
MIELRHYPTAKAFLDETEPALLADEARHGLIFGIADRLRSDNDHNSYDPNRPPYYANIHKSDTLLLSALRTPPHRLIVAAHTALDDRDLETIVQSLANDHPDGPGLNAVKEVADKLGHRLAKCYEKRLVVNRRDGFYKSTSVIAPPAVKGQCRIATEADLDIVLAWSIAFEKELHDVPYPGAEERLRARLAQGSVYVWDIGDRLTSMAVRVRTSKHGASIGFVYTPPEERGKGYASNVTAAATQMLLDSGYAFCTLFTDLANPTSNGIYQKMGYEWVCEFTELDLV